MNDALRKAAAVDPEWARNEQRKLWLLKGATTGALLAIAIGVAAFVLGVTNSTDITKLEKTACAKSPSKPSAECESLRESIARHESIVGPCILHQRATGNQGANCPKFFVPRNGSASPNLSSSGGKKSTTTTSSGGDATTSPPGHSHPGPSGGHPGNSGSPTPTTPGKPSTEVGSPPVTGNQTPEKLPPAPETSAPTSPVHTTVEHIVETVHGVTCPLLHCE